MSRAGVGLVIEKLLTDEDLRIRFAVEPMETVAELFLRGGGDLTPDEIDLFCWTDAAVWFLGDAVKGEWQLERGGPCDAATLVAGRNDRAC